MLNQINAGTITVPTSNEVFVTQTYIQSSPNCKITGCSFRYTDGSVLEISGGNTILEDNYLNYIDKTVANLSSVMTAALRINGSNNIVRRNTGHKTGASSTINPGNNSIVEYNNSWNSGYLQSDGALRYIVWLINNLVLKLDLTGSTILLNMVFVLMEMVMDMMVTFIII